MEYNNAKLWQACVAMEAIIHLWMMGESLVVSYNIKHISTIRSSNCAPWYLLKKVDKIYPHKNLHVVYTFYSSFIHTCPDLETTYILQVANG